MLLKRYILPLTLFYFLVFSSCKEDKKAIKQTEVAFKKEGELSIFKKDSATVSLDIEIADTEYETQTGLMYRSSMQTNQGMLFIFEDVAPRSFYMKNTQIPLDLIFIDENNKIVSFQKNAKPFDESSLPSNDPAKYVLEINASLVDKWNVSISDSISFSAIDKN
ncbi:hypothetical protein SAMN05428642_10344 [Flaviramulus basaltis]|uniref:DUF192 domain-containing protein n=1 Tax=Flaviramulus basaltis TaxID=369401 RepID=A0A1K2ILZ9_9FLAO|nr:DUF192 domain-containing protein [Flaviramulus basaltis]SFZ93282.1 hypothetical protein SAMN05428642_10344 [Flaviramulus basaltis]